MKNYISMKGGGFRYCTPITARDETYMLVKKQVAERNELKVYFHHLNFLSGGRDVVHQEVELQVLMEVQKSLKYHVILNL